MATGVERRQSTRLTIPSQVGGPRGQLQAVRLLELSTAGARIEHLRPVPDWKLCVLTLPPALAGIRLQGEVRWSRVIGRQPGTDGGQQVIYQSGLRFILLTPEQRTGLMTALEILRSALEASPPPHHQS